MSSSSPRRPLVSTWFGRRLAAFAFAFLFSVAAHATIDVALQMQTGNPSNATADAGNHAHYLIQRPQYALDYNDTTREPNWVAWDYTTADSGSAGRSPVFFQDTTLPAGFYQVLPTDYSGSGYDRGHMCPSADRTVTRADNDVTFYMSNMVPQAPDNNQGVWANFESYCRTVAAAGNELLIISGPSEFAGSIIASGVAIPGYTWKVVVVVPLGAGTAIDRIVAAGSAAIRVIAIRIPNIQGVRSDPWQNYITSASVIESKTGYAFFTGLPTTIANALRVKLDGQTTTGEPAIVTPPSAQTSPVGGSATFTVTATGDAPLTYQWLKDDVEISGAISATLTLTNIQAADAGNYDIIVTNVVGSVTSAAAPLVVTGLPPVITTSPASLTGAAGSAALFSVTVSGSPTFSYQWHKAGVNLANGGNVAGATGATLTLSNIQAADAASYDVVVTNSVGAATSTAATLAVTPAASTITLQPVAQTVSTGGTAVFSVVASGTTPISYQWRKGGSTLANTGVVSGATSATLTLTGISAADAGSYDVVVSNGVGSPATSSAATLTIGAAVAGRVSYTGGTYAQNFDTLPTTGNNTFSGTAPFDLSAAPVSAMGMTGWTVAATTGTPALIAGTGTANNGAAYSFGAAGSTERALGTIASGAVVPRFGVTLVNNTGVTVTQFTVSYFGEWWRNGGNTSLAAQTLPFFYSIGATDINASSPAFAGVAALGFTSPTPTSASPAAVDGNAAANRKAITSTITSISWAPGQTLVLRWDDINDTGNDHGLAVDDFTFSTPASALPTAPAVTSTTPANGVTNVAVTSPITINFNQSVNVAGSWFAINSAANGAIAATVTGGPSSFILTPPVSFANSDTITVTLFASQITESASNLLHPAANTTISFTTTASNAATAPSVTTQPFAQTVNVGGSATFTVAASGTTPLSYQWRKNGTAISGNASATTATLTLTSVATTDAGSYSCVVSNAAGSDVSASATLTVNVPAVAPSLTTQPVAQTVNSGANATFTVVASGTAPLSYQWRKGGVALTDGAVVSGSATAALTLTAVSVADVGSYDVVVTNTAGSATSNAAALGVTAAGSSTIYWNFNTAAPTSGLPADLTGGVVTQNNNNNNNNGAPVLLTVTSASNNTGASGGNNAGAAARIGALNTAAGGSAYFEFTLTPATGEQVQISGLSFGARSTGTGPQAYTVFTSADGFAAPAASGPLANDSVWRLITSSLPWLAGATSAPLTVRIYASNGAGNAQAGTANWRIDDLKVAARGVATSPLIVSTSPAAGATNVALAAPITITFNQPVAAPAASFAVTSASSGPLATTLSGGPTSFMLTPAANFAYGDTITVTVFGAQVTELNSNALTLGADASFSFTTIPPVPPSIVVPPVAQTATVGDSVTFTVVATGTAPLGYQWREGGVALAGNASATTDTLALAGITTADAGDYDVVVTNVAGSAISSAATLTVNKAVANLTLSGLTVTYDGAPKPITVGTTPGGLGIAVTYAGSTLAPANAGSYAVVAIIVDANYTGSSAATLTINRAAATVALGGLSQTYTGSPLAATATTAPAGLAVQFTYDASAAAPTNAGSYAVVATITDPNYTGSATGALTIDQAVVPVILSNLSQLFDGTPKSVTATASPTGLTINITYNSSATAPTAAGSYAVVASIANANYRGSSSATLVIAPASATITLGALTQAYDGTPQSVTTTTTPAGLAVSVTYNGSATAPTIPGTYAVVATITDPNYSGTASGTLVITVTALVRHAPTLDGDLDGSMQVLTGESLTLNGNAAVSGDILVPGTPTVRLNGHPTFVGTQDGTGSTWPSNYQVTLNGNVVLRYLVRRTDPIAMPVVSAPPAPTGTRNVSLNSASDSAGDFATIRNLTLNGNAGTRVVPAGTYGTLSANGNSGFTFGVAGATTPSVYNLQGLTLNGNNSLQILGPVVIVLANGVSFNASVAASGHPEWLALNVASGGVTLNGNMSFYGAVIAPAGTVTLNGNSTLTGGVVADRLTINGNGLLKQVTP